MECSNAVPAGSRLKTLGLQCAGLLGGLMTGVVLTHASAQYSPSEPPLLAAPQVLADVDNVDGTGAWLMASAALSPDSKAMFGLMSPRATLIGADWTWSRNELLTPHAPVTGVFGTNKPVSQESDAVIAQPAQKALQRNHLVVALDPGHGGTDPGSEAHNGLLEKELTLDMARRVELFLSEIDNVEVIMTRDSDTGMSRQDRVDTIRAVQADVVVSLHFNHLPQTNINLVESFYADKRNVKESLAAQKRSPDGLDLGFTEQSKNLAGIMHSKVYNEVATENDQVVDAGIKSETLFVLTRSFTPGVLLELTCISNPAEAERLATDEYRDQLAASIADGLRDYLMHQHADQFKELLAKLDR